MICSSKEMCHIIIHDNLLCIYCFLPHGMLWFHNLSVTKPQQVPRGTKFFHGKKTGLMFLWCYDRYGTSAFKAGGIAPRHAFWRVGVAHIISCDHVRG